jgi:Ran GTPase-activating protein (RanGAP) involved in mRNA processing and transport
MSERITDNLSSDIHEAWMDLQRLENNDCVGHTAGGPYFQALRAAREKHSHLLALDSAYQDGKNGAREITENPFAINSDERKAWQEGYNDEVLWQMQDD